LYDGADLVSTTDPLNRSTNFDVDAVGRGIGLTNGNGNRTAFNYDQFDRMVQVVDPAGQGTTKQFDANGNPTAILDAKGNSHQYAYDARNRQIAYTDPLQQTERYGYDGTGNLVNYTDRKGQVTKYTFDNLDRLALITYADGSTVTYRYDQGNRPVQIVDSVNGTIKYAYDSYDRITTETTPKGAVSYTYYPNGLRKTMTVSGQPTVRYAYDTGDRLLRIDQDAGASNNNLALSVAFTYDAANRRTQTTLPNGTTQNYSYDDAGQLTRIVYRGADGSELGDLSYSYDAAGQRIKTGGSLARTRLTDDVSSATVDAANRLTSWGGGTLTYDANGNLISDGTISYVWNARNKLTQIKGANGSVIATFEYDALGRRMSKVVNGQAVGYMYDGLNVVQALAGANVGNSDPGNVLANYLTGFALDELFAATARSGGSVRVRNYLTDALGSTVRLADAAGAKVADYTYEPYGSTSADGVDANPFQFTGRENDGTGLYYYRARYYSSKWARFISSDPIGLKGGTNTYAYARGNPVGKTDPLGLTEWSGRITNFGVSLPAGAGGQIITYRMTSKCVRGQRWIVDGQATMGAMGLGKSPIGQTDTLATFEDYLDYVNPYVFNGPALTYSAGSVALGPGYSVVGKLELGGAFADISGSQTGVDATYIQAGMGSSKVLNAKTETCGCQ
jgi:RHS repeat-associated protein